MSKYLKLDQVHNFNQKMSEVDLIKAANFNKKDV